MNNASRDLPRHVDNLRTRMMEGDSYERAVSYFLEEFAGDVEFIKGCLDA